MIRINLKKWTTFAVTIAFCLHMPLNAQQYFGDSLEIDSILKTSQAFSEAYMSEDFDRLTKFYTQEAKIMPPKAPIIEGHTDIKKRWTLPPCADIVLHEATPEEIRIIDQFAYDYGTYRGTTKNCKGIEVFWSGKYVIVWQKTGEVWKIYLDIWNSIEASE